MEFVEPGKGLEASQSNYVIIQIRKLRERNTKPITQGITASGRALTEMEVSGFPAPSTLPLSSYCS